MRVFKLIIDGKVYYETCDNTLFKHVKENVREYISRYGINGLEDFIDMVAEEAE